MIVWPLVRRPVSGSWRRRTTTQRLVWRRWFTAATCCWKRSRAPWRTLPSHSSAPATEHRASLRQPSPDRQHASWWISGQFSVISLSFQLAFFSTLKHQLKASKQKCAEFVFKEIWGAIQSANLCCFAAITKDASWKKVQNRLIHAVLCVWMFLLKNITIEVFCGLMCEWSPCFLCSCICCILSLFL